MRRLWVFVGCLVSACTQVEKASGPIGPDIFSTYHLSQLIDGKGDYADLVGGASAEDFSQVNLFSVNARRNVSLSETPTPPIAEPEPQPDPNDEVTFIGLNDLPEGWLPPPFNWQPPPDPLPGNPPLPVSGECGWNRETGSYARCGTGNVCVYPDGATHGDGIIGSCHPEQSRPMVPPWDPTYEFSGQCGCSNANPKSCQRCGAGMVCSGFLGNPRIGVCCPKGSPGCKPCSVQSGVPHCQLN